MNKKVIGFIVVVIVIIGIVWYGRSGTAPTTEPSPTPGTVSTSTPQVSAPVIENTKVSSSLSEYHDAELGFSVKYPLTWEPGKADAGVSFIIPIDKKQVSTLGKLQAEISVLPGKCGFPPVTTIKDRATVPVKDLSFNMISMSNTVQGRTYFNRMYSLPKGSICYYFTFSSITLPASSKSLTGSNATQAENNNKAIVTSADTAFNEMVKSFVFVSGPQGVDETKAPR